MQLQLNYDSEPAVFTRNLCLLTLCQLLSVSGAVLIVTLGGLIGTALTPDAALATLPLSVMVVGTAAATIFAAMLMARIGRRLGFLTGAAIALLGAGIACLGLLHNSFMLFCLGIGLVGVNSAFVQQYRFAAAESVTAAQAGPAISVILMGSIGGALLGPYIATFAVSDAGATARTFLPAMAALGGLQVLSLLLLACLRTTCVVASVDPAGPARPLGNLLRQPRYVVAVLGGVVGYGTMTFIMTATPLSMHLMHGFSLDDTAWVIRSHVLAMYLPSLVSGALVRLLGPARLLGLGVIAFAGALSAGLHGHTMVHFWWALVLLGIGWNFLYVGGTALLMQTYRESEKFAAQAVNEFSVFGASALASLLAGSVLHAYGWTTLLWSATPALLAMLIGLAWLYAGFRRSVVAPAST